jgi:hypothetical protein
MEIVCCSETSVSAYESTRRQNQKQQYDYEKKTLLSWLLREPQIFFITLR